MNKVLAGVGLVLLAAGLVSCEEKDNADKKLWGEVVTSDYLNPVYGAEAPEPGLLKARNGKYYAYTSNSLILVSDDLVNWSETGHIFETVTTKKPDISFVGSTGKYHLFYAQDSGIGLATAFKAEGPFTNVGALGIEGATDPFYFMDGEDHYLVYSTSEGVFLTELTSNALAVKKAVAPVQLAGAGMEAPMIYKKGDRFYMFCSVGTCCDGLNSTYRTVVGRSESLAGPYLDKDGDELSGDNHHVLLSSNDAFVAPGHSSAIVTDGEGRTWFLYHAYNVSRPDANRCLMLDEVKWEADGWPYVEGPSSSLQNGPVFKN